MIRSPGGRYADELLERGIVGLGWGETGPEIKKARSPQDFYEIVSNHFDDYTDQQTINAGRQLYKFFREIEVDDPVMTYDSPRRTYHIGTIVGEAEINPQEDDHFPNFRRVKWSHQIERDKLSQAARNSLGSTLTLFQPSDATVDEIDKLILSPKTATIETAPLADTETEDPFANASENSRELIKDRLMRLSWQDMQALVAGVLRAMGYKTKVSPEGSDRGKDIIASPDGLGLEQPRIFVEVKHRKAQQMGAPEVRKFIGGRDSQNDRCLFVSTGGFSTEAKYEAERARVPLTLIDSDELVELLLEYYEVADTETRALLPLRKTYWPT